MNTKKILWAPWRMSYILGKKDPGCFLCEAQAKGPGEETLVLTMTEHSLVILNRYPYANGHLMVTPRRHVARLHLLTRAERNDLHELLVQAVQIVEREFHTDGINTGMNLGKAAGAGLEEHLHYHLVPRWFGDTNAMTAVGGLRVLPEDLGAVYRRLAPAFAALATEVPAGTPTAREGVDEHIRSPEPKG